MDDVIVCRVFIPGKLRNPLNGSWGGWRKHWRSAREWREKTAMLILLEGFRAPSQFARRPKRITFTVQTGAPWDSDAVPAAVKPIRDALVDAGIIHSDAPDSGHEFLYGQRVDRKNRGVDIVVEARSRHGA